MPIYSIDNFTSFAGGLDHPECVAWGLDGFAYAGGEAGQIYRVSLEGEVTRLAQTGGFILGVCLDAMNNIYACDVARNLVLKVTPEGEMSVYSEGSPDRKFLSPNFGLFDRYGSMYVTASGVAGQNNACLFRIRPGGETEVVSDEVKANANGLALSPDGRSLYLALTDAQSVVRLSLPDSPEGSLGSPEPVVQLDRAIPDGLGMDAQGNLYIGCYAPDAIYRLSPEGRLEVFAEDWKRSTLASPVNIAWAGPEWKTMLVSNFARWDLVKGQVDIPGYPPNYPTL